MSFRGVESRMTLGDVERLGRAWARNGPPTYIVTAVANGWKPKKEQTEDERFDELMKAFG